MNIQCIGKKSEEAKEHRSQTYWRAASRGHDWQPTSMHKLEANKRKNKAYQKPNQARYFIIEKYIQRVQVP
jgi:hypothetical protein